MYIIINMDSSNSCCTNKILLNIYNSNSVRYHSYFFTVLIFSVTNMIVHRVPIAKDYEFFVLNTPKNRKYVNIFTHPGPYSSTMSIYHDIEKITKCCTPLRRLWYYFCYYCPIVVTDRSSRGVWLPNGGRVSVEIIRIEKVLSKFKKIMFQTLQLGETEESRNWSRETQPGQSTIIYNNNNVMKNTDHFIIDYMAFNHNSESDLTNHG